MSPERPPNSANGPASTAIATPPRVAHRGLLTDFAVDLRDACPQLAVQGSRLVEQDAGVADRLPSSSDAEVHGTVYLRQLRSCGWCSTNCAPPGVGQRSLPVGNIGDCESDNLPSLAAQKL